VSARRGGPAERRRDMTDDIKDRAPSAAVERGRWYPYMPPMLPGEALDTYTDRLTGGAREEETLEGEVLVVRPEKENMASDFHMRHVGKTCTYQCDDCGRKAPSGPMPPPPTLGFFPLPEGWELGVSGPAEDSPLYCTTCAPRHELKKDAPS